jgi:hypothetical protein
MRCTEPSQAVIVAFNKSWADDRLSHTNIKDWIHDRLSHTNIKEGVYDRALPH